jgi:hypothetical protein
VHFWVAVCVPVVPDTAQIVPVLIARTFTELPEIIVVKENSSLQFMTSPTIASIELEPQIIVYYIISDRNASVYQITI